jgi:hypothetical protein
MRPIVISYETADRPDHPGLVRLQRSLAKWGWDAVIGHEMHWRGFGRKLKKCVEMAEQAKSAGYTHGVFIDAFDVVAIGGPADFPTPPCPLWLAAEMGCWPDAGKAPLYPPCDTPWKYAHSPLVVDLSRLDLLEAGTLADGDDDQRHLTDVFLRHYAEWDGPLLGGLLEAQLDTGCRWMQSVAFAHPWAEFFEVVGDRVRNKVTGTLPFFAHANGRTGMSWVPGSEGMP